MSLNGLNTNEVIALAREYAAWAEANREVEPEEMPPSPSVSKIDLARVLVESHDKHERLLMVLRDLLAQMDASPNYNAVNAFTNAVRKLTAP